VGESGRNLGYNPSNPCSALTNKTTSYLIRNGGFFRRITVLSAQANNCTYCTIATRNAIEITTFTSTYLILPPVNPSFANRPSQALRGAVAAFRPSATASSLQPRISHHLLQTRLLSQEVRTAIDKAVASAPVVLFMKGTPETPQCGFSRTSIQILGMQGVNPAKFTAFNVLEDDELRSGTHSKLPRCPQGPIVPRK
jgi:monothiol glutaredoxin